MGNIAVIRGIKKGLRTLIQTIAGGGFTALVALIANGLSPDSKAILLAAFTTVIAVLQNYLESSGTIPVIFPAPPIPVTPEPETVI